MEHDDKDSDRLPLESMIFLSLGCRGRKLPLNKPSTSSLGRRRVSDRITSHSFPDVRLNAFQILAIFVIKVITHGTVVDVLVVGGGAVVIAGGNEQ